jgi:WD40 repeat protein
VDGIADLAVNRVKGNELATASFDHNVNVYNLEKYQLVKTLKAHTKGVWCCDYSPKEDILLSGGNDNQVILWDNKTNKPVKQITGVHDEAVYDAVFSHDGQMFASCSKGKIALWDIKRLEKPIAFMEAKESKFIYSLNFTNSNNALIAGTIDGNLLLFDTNKLEVISQVYIPYEKLKIEENQDPGNAVSQYI